MGAVQQISAYRGRSLRRPEDIPLTEGKAKFVGDISRPGQLFARVVRSNVAHGRLLGIELDDARSVEGVAAVVTAADLPDVRVPIRMPLGNLEQQEKALQPPLARDRVRYVGEPLAVVVATSPAIAEDAAALIFADVEEVEPVLDAPAGATADAPVLHEALGDNIADRVYWRKGDVDALFDAADVVVSERLTTQRHTGVPMETRGLLAEWDSATERLTIWGAAKVKHFNRAALAGMLGLEEEALNLVECEVGGGFGVRGELYPEDYLIAWLARDLGRPVKWIEDRIEHLVAANHSREQVHVLEIAARADGTLLAFRDNAHSDMGAYIRTHGSIVQVAASTQLPGGYRWQGFEIDHALVLTNKTPTGTYRGPGGVEVSFVRERLLDTLAGKLGIAPTELRRRNLITPADSPYTVDYDVGPPPYVHDHGDYLAIWDEMIERAGGEALVERLRERRAAGETVGFGTATFAEVAVIGPWEQARVTAEADGTFRVAIGVSSVGQGVRTALGQIAADALGVDFESVVVDYGSTDATPFGFGAFASRVTTVGGNAVHLACEDLVRKGLEPGNVGEGKFDKPGMSVGFGGAVAVIAVDPETGVLTIERLIVATELGNPVNPEMVRGQIVGAAAQGVGGALLESFVYDEVGQPLSTTFADYMLPTATDVPEIEIVSEVVPAVDNPLGLGPAGENGIYGVAPAIANALVDALGDRPGLATDLPLTPERIWDAVREANAGAPAW
ncbi:MAG TPA: xanthine dehydrogenase family protein molybdopterin-binding subunit [Solirubrobacterales bacterium]|jgi:carbon-monoxide dehydrogenase large subunit